MSFAIGQQCICCHSVLFFFHRPSNLLRLFHPDASLSKLIRKMDKVQTLAHIEHSLDYSVFDVKWIPFSAKFISIGTKSNGKGVIQIYELDSPKLNLVKEITQENSLKCCSFGISSAGERHLAVGDFSGKLKIL
jgi:WD40 repeat protein